MVKEEILAWALQNGWQMIGDHPSLVKPAKPKEAIVRIVLKGTVANLEIKKPSGKWEKVSGAPLWRDHGRPRDRHPPWSWPCQHHGFDDADAGKQGSPHDGDELGRVFACVA